MSIPALGPTMPNAAPLYRAAAIGLCVGVALSVIKITTGMVGGSYALIADGIESLADVLSSIVMLAGVRISLRPPDTRHPFGHGRAESLAGLLISATLLFAAGLIAWQSIAAIRAPLVPPSWFTLPVLAGVIVLKVTMARWLARVGRESGARTAVSEAWHHTADALTSGAAFIGISIALIGGPAWAIADPIAALLACVVIAWNGAQLLRENVDELLDATPGEEVEQQVRAIAASVPRVACIEKCRVRKAGLGLLMDIHVHVDGHLSVLEGHEIARAVKRALLESPTPVIDVVVHIEPCEETPPTAN